ncbi:hypothetical protein EDB86DRAFT_2831388 [Lactarius hatsudake]|nr:hypothetical protein EDB86DRAFT_2831388 [Lactarius hatsudake]
MPALSSVIVLSIPSIVSQVWRRLGNLQSVSRPTITVTCGMHFPAAEHKLETLETHGALPFPLPLRCAPILILYHLAMSLSNEERTRPSPSPTLPTVTQSLPPLPTISSVRLLRQVFTHSSMSAGPRNGFEAPHDDPMRDNEGQVLLLPPSRLAHIGDGVLGLAVTDLIQGRYPRLHVGPTSAVQKVRDRIKCGGTLAKITIQYRLHERLRGEGPRLRDVRSVQVNVFKAYVGGLFKEQGVDVVKRWLDPLFEPFVDVAYWAERQHHLSLEPVAPATPSPTPSLSPPPQWIAPAPSPPGRAAEGLKQVDVKGGSEATTARNRPPQQRHNPAAAGASPRATDGPRGQHMQRRIGSRDGGRGDADAPNSEFLSLGRPSGTSPRRRSPATAESTEGSARKRRREAPREALRKLLRKFSDSTKGPMKDGKMLRVKGGI